MTHAPYIVAAYAVAGATIAATVARIVLRHRALRRSLAKFGPREARDA
jgi:heme exporter protein CcmD